MNKYILGEIATYVNDKISSSNISLEQYITTDSLLQNKNGREYAKNLPPTITNLTHYKPCDVLISNIRPYLKKLWFADCEGGASPDVLVLRAKNPNDAKFLYAICAQDSFFDYAMKGTKGSKMPRGDKEQIMRYKIHPSSFFNRIGIGNLLSALDEKIELNRKINDNLEAMAKQLYDYWFVQFDFPNEEGKPYKSSGGKMVWNEKLKREIPDGWEVKKLKEVLQHINTGLNPRDNFVFGGNIKYITVKNLTTNNYIDFSKCDTIDEEAHKKVHKRSRISSGDILYASICPLGRTYLITEEPIDWDINESVFSIRPNHNEITSEYLNMLLKDEYYIATLSNSSTGSIFLGIRIKQLEETHILLPQKDIQNIFSQKIKNIIQLQVNHFKQIESLTKQRDELLPLLMNGQVSVK